MTASRGKKDDQAGVALVQSVSRLLSTAGLQTEGHPAILEAAGGVCAAIKEGAEDPALLQNVAGTLFLNGSRIRLPDGLLDVAMALQKQLDAANVAELEFRRSVPPAQLAALGGWFRTRKKAGAAAGGPPFQTEGVRVRAARSAVAAMTPSELLMDTYMRLAVMLAEELNTREPLRVNRFRRGVQKLVDALRGQETRLLTLVQHRDGSLDPRAFHGTAMAACALVMGRRLGLTKSELADLALAALFVDAGRPAGSPVGLSAADREMQLARAPLLAATRLLVPPITPPAVDRVLVAHEISLNLEQTRALTTASLLGRLLAPVSAFCGLVHPPPPARGLVPHQAVRILLSNADIRFDIRILRLFTASLGIFPVGSLVRLSTGRAALVLDVPSRGAAADRPPLKVLADASGAVEFVLDLADEPADIHIVGAVDEHEVVVNPVQLLFA
jgi:hypothetical protein